MKCLFTLSLALLFLSSKVLSQNPNMFDFHITCNDNASPACSAMDTYNRAGQIISDNLILNTKIIVEITVERRPETFWGNYAFQLTFIIKLLLISVLTSTCFECLNRCYLSSESI